MATEDVTNDVMLRQDRSGGTVAAFFPGRLADPFGHCDCYDFQGGHTAADLALCVAATRPATAEQAENMLATLTKIGYKGLRVVKRSGEKHRRAIREQLAKLGK